jgi:hypothetical protein
MEASAMQKITLFCASLATMLALSLPAQTQAQDRATQGQSNQPSTTQNDVGGVQSLIYVVSGIADNGGTLGTGMATTLSLHQCQHGDGAIAHHRV